MYLLDDPLSAVDAEVGQHLFKQVTYALDLQKSIINASIMLSLVLLREVLLLAALP